MSVLQRVNPTPSPPQNPREFAMSESRDYLEMSVKSIKCFANDGKLDADELAKLVAIAERDGKFDANEVRVLQSIIRRIKPDEIDAPMKARLAELSRKLGFTADAV